MSKVFFKSQLLYFSLCIFLAPSLAPQTPNSIIATVTGFTQPTQLSVTPNGQYAYVIDSSGNKIEIVDLRTTSTAYNTVIDTITGLNNPQWAGITPNGQYAYISNYGNNTLSVISLATNTIITTITSGTFNEPGNINITPDGALAFVYNTGNFTMSVVDLTPTSPTYNMVIDTVSNVGNSHSSFDITPNSQYLYAPINTSTSTIAVIDAVPSSPSFLDTVAIVHNVNNLPGYIGITPNGLSAYVASYDTVYPIIYQVDLDPSNSTYNTIIGSVTGGINFPASIAITPNSAYAYLPQRGNSEVAVVDISPTSPTYNKLIIQIPGINNTRYATITPNGAYAYVTNLSSTPPSLSVIFIDVPITPPTNLYAVSTESGTEVTNTISWQPPVDSLNAPVSYSIYRDSGLTDLVVTVSADVLEYADTNLLPNVSYSYYVVATDVYNDVSTANSVTIEFVQPIISPSDVQGIALSSNFLFQKDLINSISWQAPVDSLNAPVSYSIYRDAALTDLVVTVSADTLQYADHNRQPNTVYTYYIVATDVYNDVSAANSVIIAQP